MEEQPIEVTPPSITQLDLWQTRIIEYFLTAVALVYIQAGLLGG